MLKRIVVLIILTLATGILVSANTGQSASNDPNESPTANGCFEGGSMEGKCQTETEWRAGWYVIRYEYGIFTRDQVPSWAAWAIRPAVCTHTGSLFGQAGLIFMDGTLEVFLDDLTCSGAADNTLSGMTFLPDLGPGAVYEICNPSGFFAADQGTFYKCS